MSYSTPNFPQLLPPIISTASMFGIGTVTRLLAGGPTATTAWGTANLARYIPFWIPSDYLVRKLACYCGTTSGAGNNDMGVFDLNGNQVIVATAAAHPAASAWQEFDVTDTVLVPGLYYVGLLHTTTTGTFLAWANLEYVRAAGVFSQAVGAGNLPATATFAAASGAVLPIVAMSSRVTL